MESRGTVIKDPRPVYVEFVPGCGIPFNELCVLCGFPVERTGAPGVDSRTAFKCTEADCATTFWVPDEIVPRSDSNGA